MEKEIFYGIKSQLKIIVHIPKNTLQSSSENFNSVMNADL